MTYAVKANDNAGVIDTLAKGGMQAFDVASPVEIDAVRALVPGAVLHYNNPVRGGWEIAHAVQAGVASYSVDGLGELAKLVEAVPKGAEMSVRLALPVEGAAYHFGEKFGEGPEGAVELLRAVVAAGYVPSMTFHVGTQCADPAAWTRYIETCAEVAREAGVRLARLNVAGAFRPIAGAVRRWSRSLPRSARPCRTLFPEDRPELLCEPGRAMVADAFTAAFKVKAERACGALFLNDGIYGLLAELPIIGPHQRLRVVTEGGTLREGPTRPYVLYGPTCDSLDKLPDTVDLPETTREGDYVIFDGIGAYSTATNTRFNGYGSHEVVTVRRSGHRASGG